MPITVWSYLEEYAAEKAEVHEAIEAALSSGRLIFGQFGRDFEAAFSSYVECAHGVGCGNGTDALFLALKALGIGPGDEVLTVSNTAVPTVSAIVSTGATPKFVDIDPATYLMDVSQLEAAVTERTRCLLPVHLYGQCVDMCGLTQVAERHGLKVLEDCAQSHGAAQGGQKGGSFGDASSFSFYPTKPLGAMGDGGMVCTPHEEVAEKLRRLRFYGMEKQYYALEHGYNSRLDEVQAAILLKKLARLDGYIERRRAIAARYDAALADTALTLPATAPGNDHVFYLYVVRHPRRDDILAGLKEREILVNVSYPWPIHTMTGYAHLGGQEGDLPETEAAAKEILSLPMYPSLTDEQVDTVCAALREILGGFEGAS